jgi:hypothetical protein
VARAGEALEAAAGHALGKHLENDSGIESRSP